MSDTVVVQCDKRVRRYPHHWRCLNRFSVPVDRDVTAPSYCHVHRKKSS